MRLPQWTKHFDFLGSSWLHTKTKKCTFFWLDSMIIRPTTKMTLVLPDFQWFQHFFNIWLSTFLILWRSDLCSMIVWPTTKMASALPDFPIFDWVHFKTWFFDGPTYDKFGLWSLWFSKNDGVHFFWLYFMIVWPTTKTASALPDFSMFDWVHF